MKNIILLFLLSTLVFSCSKSDDQNPDSGVDIPIEPDPDPDPDPEPGDPESGYNTPEINYSDYDSAANEVVTTEVEPQFSSAELTKIRFNYEEYVTDRPHSDLLEQELFSNQINYYVYLHLFNTKPELASMAPYYFVPSKIEDHNISGLSHFNLCHSTSSSLAATIKSSKVPPQHVIDMLNDFEGKMNELKEETINDYNSSSKQELINMWSKFMGCLAYTESLTTADSSTSYKVSDQYSPSDFDKPEGVKFYEDPYQPPESRLNIGLFQFTPNSGGNINPCLLHWNTLFPDTQVKTNENQDNLIRMYGSSFQGMNAFCGVNKIVQTFSIQVNTSDSGRTHPDNKVDGKLLDPPNRCVTPWIYASYAYNHFGPLQNSTGTNLEKLISCVMK